MGSFSADGKLTGRTATIDEHELFKKAKSSAPSRFTCVVQLAKHC